MVWRGGYKGYMVVTGMEGGKGWYGEGVRGGIERRG